MQDEASMTPEERFNAEAVQLAEKLVGDFVRLLTRYRRPVEPRSELEIGEIAARISVLLEGFYRPGNHSYDPEA